MILIVFSLFVCANQLSVNNITWYENQSPGIIQRIKTDDDTFYTSNYTFEFDKTIDTNTKNTFNVSIDGVLISLISLDREQQKEYVIPIIVRNKKNLLDKIVKEIHLIVGDVNDNKMKEGESSIKLLKMEGTEMPEMDIGRVFVNDLDDDDLIDKVFRWSNHVPVSPYNLDENTGMLKISANANDSQTLNGDYELKFTVIDKSPKYDHSVDAIVNISVRTISEEAVSKSVSIRFHGIKVEQFIKVTLKGNLNSIEVLRNLIVDLFETTPESIEIITISQKSFEPLLMDIRFYVKNNESGNYYEPEFINIKLFENRNRIENIMEHKIQMINIDECAASMHCNTSCYNEIVILPNYIPLITNQTSFYGINSYVKAQCGCETLGQLISFNESTVIEFKGNGYAVYSSISYCDTMNISLVINSYINSGIILYIGPMNSDEREFGDFMELKLENDLLILTLKFGSVSIQMGDFLLPRKKNHSIEINYNNNAIELVVRDCFSCPRKFEILSTTKLPKLSFPIQLGGIMEFLTESFSGNQGFYGCISNFTINDRLINVMTPLLNSYVSYECHLSTG